MRDKTEHNVTPGDGKRRQHSGLGEADPPALAELEAADTTAKVGDNGVSFDALGAAQARP